MKDYVNRLAQFQNSIKLLAVLAGIVTLIFHQWTTLSLCLGILVYDVLKSKLHIETALDAQDKAIKGSLDDIRDIKSTLTIIKGKMGFNKL
jgi:hypothetical protein